VRQCQNHRGIYIYADGIMKNILLKIIIIKTDSFICITSSLKHLSAFQFNYSVYIVEIISKETG